jgi:hypothetical protein
MLELKRTIYANEKYSTTDEQTESFANGILSIFGASTENHPFLLLLIRGVSFSLFSRIPLKSATFENGSHPLL